MGSPAWEAQRDAHLIGDRAPALPVHPTEIYLSLLNFVTFAILYFAIRRRKRFDGQIFAWLLILKGVFRSFVEIWRDDERGVLWGWLSTSQIISLPLIVCGIYLLVRHRPDAGPAAQTAA
jgi:phosphatidylglycerol:prolipoprotein diacylglycerol transferase